MKTTIRILSVEGGKRKHFKQMTVEARPKLVADTIKSALEKRDIF